MPVLGREHHIERKGQVLHDTDTGRPQHPPVGSVPAQPVMRRLAGPVEAEGHAREPRAVAQEQRVDAGER